jgi:putative ABC transport system permease protein
MESAVLQDLRFTFRLMAKERWFSVIGIVVLALGIGANAIGFTIVNAAFLRGLPFKNADRIVALSWLAEQGRRGVSAADLDDWRAQSRAFRDLAGYTSGPANLSDDRALPEQARGTWVTANTFRLLGQSPLLGRDFAPSDDRPGAEPVVLISHRVWKNRYGADPNVLGLAVRVDGKPATIVGVMPDRMNFPDNTEIWVPFVPTEAQKARNARTLMVFGRLQDGRSLGEAQSELNGIGRQLMDVYPDSYKGLIGVRVESFTDRYVGGPARVVFLVMMGAVSFVLLIACANVANLLISRSAHRARELAVRIALGASRWRVVRQLLLESIVLGCIGGGVGLLLATIGVRYLDAAVTDPGKPYWIAFTVDYTVFGYVAAVCVATGVLFGLAPALHVSKPNLNGVLKEGGRGAAGSVRVRWLTSVMVVVELALTIVLLAGAGLMIRSFLKLYSIDIGFPTDHLTTMALQLPATKYQSGEERRTFYEQLESRIAALPGVESAALTTSVPPHPSGERGVEIEGQVVAPGDPRPTTSTVWISPTFFDALDVRPRRGRAFDARDGASGVETAIVNERMAVQLFPGEDPIGKRIRFPAAQGEPAPAWHTIVGISPTIRHGSSRRGYEPNPVAYLPLREDAPRSASILIRSQLPPASVMDAVRRAVQLIDQDQPIFTIQTMDQVLDEDRWPYRVFGGLFTLFAAIALLLSSVGLYGVMAYSVTQRTQEIGVRLALGADARQMSWLVLKRGLLQLAVGLTIGLGAALALSQVMRGVLVQISTTDPATFTVITVVLTIVSIAACLLPARRATRVDPVVALRAE